MGNNKSIKEKSRRWFITLGLFDKKKTSGEKVKLLTADGKLVEVDKEAIDNADKTKVSNKDIFEWMQNPSKP